MAIEAANLVVKIGADVSKFVKGMKTADQNLNKFSSAAAKSGLIMTGAITAPAIAAAKGMLDVAFSMEQSKVAFTTMLESGEEAERFLMDLRDFAESTPFEFTELQDASRRLLAFGFSAKEILPMMRDIGDAVSGLGLGADGVNRVVTALGQMQAKSKVSAQEMMQLTEAGIPAWSYLADAIGVSTAEAMKMTEKGLLPADQAIQSILLGMRSDFGGMMAEQSKTAAGQLSNLRDEVQGLAADLGEDLLPIAKDMLAGAKTAVSAFAEMPEEGQKALLTFIGIAAAAGPAMTAVAGISSAISGLVVVLPSLQASFALMAGAKGVGSALSVATLGLSGLAAVALPAAVAIAAVAVAWNKFITQTNKAGHEMVDQTWSAFFDDQVKSGKSATEVLSEYHAAQSRVNKQLEDAGALRIFIKDQDKLTGNTELLNNALAQASESYTEYLETAYYSGEITEYLSESGWNAAKGMSDLGDEAVDAALDLGQYVNTVDDASAAFDEMVAAAGRTRTQLSGVLEDYERIDSEMQSWVSSTASSVENMLGQRLYKASDQYKQGLEGIDEVMGTQYAKQYELEASVKGLVDQYARDNDLEAFKEGLQKIKNEGLADMQTSLEEAATKAQELYDKLIELPEEIRVKIGFDIEELPDWLFGQLSTTMAVRGVDDPRAEALGGSVFPGMPYLVGERGMEIFVPETAGKIVPNNQLSGVGGGNVFEPGAITVYANSDIDIPYLVDDIMEKIEERLG